MSLNASEYFEAGLALPASVRKDVALRLLESLEVVDDARADENAEAWTEEISSRVDDLVSGRVQAVPHAEVLARLAQRREARRAPEHRHP